MPDDFVIARNPDPDSRLPYLLRIPLGPGVLLKARDTWPRTQAVYCHSSDGWPDDPEIIERIAVPIIVDDQEKYPYRFTGQRLSTERRRLPAGDYAVEMGGQVVASVERKTLPDLVSSLVSGRLGYAMADLAALPRAAVVVEERYSRLFKQEHVRGAVAVDALTEAQVRWPSVPIVFCESRRLAEDWTHRFLMAALSEIGGLEVTGQRERALTPAPRLERRPPTTREMRQWAQAAGLPVAARGGLRSEVVDAYMAAHVATD
jgi:hypothetical protein